MTDDPLSERALRLALERGAATHETDASGQRRAVRIPVEDLTGLRLTVGLSDEEQFEEWAVALASRWKVRDSGALARVAGDAPREATKIRLVRLGLLSALAAGGGVWRGRVGSGTGSEWVEVVPREAGLLGQLKWLAQEALSQANVALREEDPLRHEVMPIRPDLVDTRPTVLDAIIAAESTPEGLAEVLEVATSSQTRVLDEILRCLQEGDDFSAARVRAAAQLGVSENAVDVAFHRLRKRLDSK